MKGRTAPGQSGRRIAAGAVAIALLSACSFEVTNPGPVQDKFLDGPLAYDGVVAGVQRALLDAHYDYDMNNASGSREIFPGGNIARHGISSASERIGIFDMTVTGGYWNAGQNARWLAENAVARFKSSMPSATYATARQAGMVNLYAGYANRHLGELFCQAVIDGGPLQPNSEYFTRSDTFFTAAMTIFTAGGQPALANAARAGRASARANLNNWAGAVADAATIPNSFQFVLDYFNLEELQWNFWIAATASEPFRTITVWNTFYESYFQQTGDPRVPWDTVTAQRFGSALVAPYGNVPFYRPRKFKIRDDDVRLSSGREMRLIEAEAALQGGNFNSAMTIINAIRADLTLRTIVTPGITLPSVTANQALQPWPAAANIVEAGTAFKKEHGIELWLEGRRFGARARWVRQTLPGNLTVWEVPSTTVPVHGLGPTGAGTLLATNSTLCMDVPQAERQRNPNIVYP